MYCNFSKNKFNNEITYIIPTWLDIPEGEAYFHDGINFRVGANKEFFGESVNSKAWNRNNNWKEVDSFLHSLDVSEKVYFDLLNLGWTPQQARQVLPNALKTELVMTGFISDWKHFIDLRYRGTTGKPHPDAFYLAEKLYNLFKERGIEV